MRPPRLKRVTHAVSVMSTELEEVPMRIVVALDVHRRQITYKTLDRESGEVRRGWIVPATRGAVLTCSPPELTVQAACFCSSG